MKKLHKELFKFLSLCYERKEKGIKYTELEETFSKETITWLINNHYIAHKRNAEYIWIAWTNKWHSDCTIRKLEEQLIKETMVVVIDDMFHNLGFC